MTAPSPKSDLAYLRDLAEAGQSAPLVGGRISVWWGGLTSLTMVIHWAIAAHYLPLDARAFLPLWLSYMVIGSLGSFLLIRTVKTMPGAGSINNRVIASVWPSAGIGIFASFIGVFIGVSTGQLPGIAFNYLLPFALLAYTIAWLTTAMMARDVKHAIPGVIAGLGLIASVIFVMSAHVYLVTALAIFFSTLIPGLMQMRSEPKSVI
ncbi:hypothetical protein [Woodsholea maritima]|uniref:hypothetical protein n=1 Tax=Woodsholea maritima TaxID=240237 RepID=UPI000369B68D|nr:hypothetical protein [Woodsholea maritima]